MSRRGICLHNEFFNHVHLVDMFDGVILKSVTIFYSHPIYTELPGEECSLEPLLTVEPFNFTLWKPSKLESNCSAPQARHL